MGIVLWTALALAGDGGGLATPTDETFGLREDGEAVGRLRLATSTFAEEALRRGSLLNLPSGAAGELHVGVWLSREVRVGPLRDPESRGLWGPESWSIETGLRRSDLRESRSVDGSSGTRVRGGVIGHVEGGVIGRVEGGEARCPREADLQSDVDWRASEQSFPLLARARSDGDATVARVACTLRDHAMVHTGTARWSSDATGTTFTARFDDPSGDGLAGVLAARVDAGGRLLGWTEALDGRILQAIPCEDAEDCAPSGPGVLGWDPASLDEDEDLRATIRAFAEAWAGMGGADALERRIDREAVAASSDARDVAGFDLHLRVARGAWAQAAEHQAPTAHVWPDARPLLRVFRRGDEALVVAQGLQGWIARFTADGAPWTLTAVGEAAAL